MTLPPVVGNIIAALYDVVKAYLHTYSVIKDAVNAYLDPLTKKFDLVDIILVWTVLFIIASSIYSRFRYAQKRGTILSLFAPANT